MKEAERIIGLLLILIHYISIEKKKIKRLITFTDISFMLLSMAFITLDKYIIQLALIFTVSSLVSKTILLGKYNIEDIQDFTLHYFSVIIAIMLFNGYDNSSIDFRFLLAILLGIFVLHSVYYLITNKYVYRSIPVDKPIGIIKLSSHSIVVLTIYYIIKTGLYKPDNWYYLSKI